MGIALLLMLALAGCGEYTEEAMQVSEASSKIGVTLPVIEEPITLSRDALTGPHSIPNSLSFASLQELMSACKTAREGGDMTKYVPEWVEDPAEYVETINLAALDKIYLPTNIPEPYRLNGIFVYEEGVRVRYLREEDLASEYARQLTHVTFQYYSFYFSRSDHDSMDDVLRANHLTNKDLVDGKYWLSGDRTLRWVMDGRIMCLDLAASTEVVFKEISIVEYLGLDSVDDLAQFTEVKIIELN